MNDRLNIALLVSVLPSRSKQGPGYQMHYLANELIKRGHKVTIFSMDPKPDDALYEVRIVKVKDRFRIFRYMWALSRIDYSEFDVIHASGDDALLFLPKNKPPHLRTFMGSSLSEALHMLKQPKQCIKTLLLAFFEYVSILVADKCVLISKYTKRFIPFVKDVVYCAVDTDKFKPSENKSQRPSILFVGTLGWRKRGDMLVGLFREQIKQKVPDAELWLVTNQEAEGEGVVNFGRVSSEKLIQLYQDAWVFCLPSTYEGFGVPYVEAMASGTPVVASNNLGALEVLDNGKYGVIAQDSEIASSIIEILKDSHLRNDLIKKGLDRVKSFSLSEMTSQYESIYKDLINKNA